MSATVHIGPERGGPGTPPVLVVVAASHGGVVALFDLVEGMLADIALPITFIQHAPLSDDPGRLPRLLQRRTTLPVRTAEDGISALVGGITVVPGGSTATIDPDGCYHLGTPAGRRRADLLFASAAAAMGTKVIGVVLSGLLDDGCEGVRQIKRRGGRVLAQDPATAAGANMPTNAIATGCVDFVLPPRLMGAALVALSVAPGGAKLLTVAAPPWASLYA